MILYLLWINAPQSYNSSQMWAEPDVDHAAKLMRSVYDHRQEAKERGENLKKYVIDHFSNRKTSKKLIDLLRNL